MSKYDWSDVTTDVGTTVSGRLANEIHHGFGGDMKALSMSDQKDATMAELLARTSEVFNVKSYGATGDGSTDDAAAIQAAIDAASVFSESSDQSQGGWVYLPPGTYNVASSLLFTVPIRFGGTFVDWFRGPSVPPRSGAIIESAITDSTPVIKVTGVELGAGRLDMLHPRFDHFAIIGNGSEGDAIQFATDGTIRGAMLDDIQIWTVGGSGVSVENTNFRFDQSTWNHVIVSSVGEDGFFISTGGDADTTLGLRIVECRANACGRYGFYALDFNNFELTSFVEDSSVSGAIRFDGVRHAKILGAVTETSDADGLKLIDSHNNTFVGGSFAQCVGDQIEIEDSRNNKFIGVHISQVASEDHVSFDATSHNNTFIGTSSSETLQITDAGTSNVFEYDHVVSNSSAQDRTIRATGGDPMIWGTPTERFRVAGTGPEARRDAADANFTASVGGSGSPAFIAKRSGGTHASPTDVSNGQGIFKLLAQAYSGSFFNVAQILGVIDGSVTTAQRPPTAFDFYTNASNGAVTRYLRLRASGDWEVIGRELHTTVTTLADDGTPTVAAGNLFKSGGTTSITDFDNGVVGQTIQILAAHGIKITYNASIIILAGAADYDMTDTDTLTLTMFNDQVWQEVARSVN